jgi:aminoglycoside phosphotransferase (APT) family kinase protein
MDHLDGRIIWGNEMPDSNPEERAAVYESMIEVLARLHKVDYLAVGLGDYGKPTDYIARTLNRFIGQYHLPETTKIPEMDWLAEWLPANIPPEEPATIVHGDYKLANLVLHPTEPKVIGILDWELSTIGAPLADLAVHCLYYRQGADVPGGLEHLDLKAMGIPTEQELLAKYCQYSGRESIPHWEYYMAAMLFRHAQISLGILARAQKGTAASDQALMMGRRAWPQSKAAYDIAQRIS